MAHSGSGAAPSQASQRAPLALLGFDGSVVLFGCMCCLSEPPSPCPCAVCAALWQRVAGWLLVIPGTIPGEDGLNQEPTTSLIGATSPLFWTNLLKSFVFPFPLENLFSPFHSLGVKSLLSVTPPGLIWPVFFPISQLKTQLKDVLTNHCKGSNFLSKCSPWAESFM